MLVHAKKKFHHGAVMLPIGIQPRFNLVFLSLCLVSCVILQNCKRSIIEQFPRIDSKEISLEGSFGPVKFVVEIADTQKKIAQGLMFRKNLAADHGMLFVFNETSHHSFWMKNTYIPLDLIFFDDNFKIVGLIENAQPQSLDYLQIDKPSRFVLEVNAGTIKRYGIKKNE